MPFKIVSIKIARPGGAMTETLGISRTEPEVAGSPFSGRVYRMPQTTIQRDEGKPGAATIDQMRRARFDAGADVRKGDILFIPSDDDPSATERALVLRVRRYEHGVQCDLETGAEG